MTRLMTRLWLVLVMSSRSSSIISSEDLEISQDIFFIFLLAENISDEIVEPSFSVSRVSSLSCEDKCGDSNARLCSYFCRLSGHQVTW